MFIELKGLKVKKIFFGFLTVFFTVTASAKDTSSRIVNNPLKDILIVFSDSYSGDNQTNLKKYSEIRGLKWKYKEMDKNSKIFNSSLIKLKILGKSEIYLFGKNESVDSIRLSSAKTTKRFKRILEANLGKGTVTELNGCKDYSNKNQKSYKVNLGDNPSFYVTAETNFEFEPYMTPIGTDFEFYKTKPDDWKC